MIGEHEQDEKHLVVKGAFLNSILSILNTDKGKLHAQHFSSPSSRMVENNSDGASPFAAAGYLHKHFLDETNIFVSFAVRLRVKCWYLLHLVDTVFHSPHHCYSSTITHVHRQSGSGKTSIIIN